MNTYKFSNLMKSAKGGSAGFLAGCFASLAVPWEAVKLRCQCHKISSINPSLHSLPEEIVSFFSVVNDQGFKGFFTDLPVALMRNSVYHCLRFALYESFNSCADPGSAG